MCHIDNRYDVYVINFLAPINKHPVELPSGAICSTFCTLGNNHGFVKDVAFPVFSVVQTETGVECLPPAWSLFAAVYDLCNHSWAY